MPPEAECGDPRCGAGRRTRPSASTRAGRATTGRSTRACDGGRQTGRAGAASPESAAAAAEPPPARPRATPAGGAPAQQCCRALDGARLSSAVFFIGLVIGRALEDAPRPGRARRRSFARSSPRRWRRCETVTVDRRREPLIRAGACGRSSASRGPLGGLSEPTSGSPPRAERRGEADPDPDAAAGAREPVGNVDSAHEHEDRPDAADRGDDGTRRERSAGARAPSRCRRSRTSTARPTKKTSLPIVPVCQPMTETSRPGSAAGVPARERAEGEDEPGDPREGLATGSRWSGAPVVAV